MHKKLAKGTEKNHRNVQPGKMASGLRYKYITFEAKSATMQD
jgi:hypothetical protein